MKETKKPLTGGKVNGKTGKVPKAVGDPIINAGKTKLKFNAVTSAASSVRRLIENDNPWSWAKNAENLNPLIELHQGVDDLIGDFGTAFLACNDVKDLKLVYGDTFVAECREFNDNLTEPIADLKSEIDRLHQMHKIHLGSRRGAA